jgi:hypothetical protein
LLVPEDTKFAQLDELAALETVNDENAVPSIFSTPTLYWPDVELE